MKIKFKKDQIKSLINLYMRMMEEGYKIEYWAYQKEKYNILGIHCTKWKKSDIL